MGSRLEQKSASVRKQIEKHDFTGEDGDEYKGSRFGGFPEYFRRKKIKLQNLDHELRAQSADNPQIFKGVVCHVNGYTQPSLNDLHTLIVQHGGGFIQYLDGKTMATHIIASNLTPKKKDEFRRYRIVKPAWVIDSVNAAKLLPWDAYRVVDEGVGQKVLGFHNGQVTSQAAKKVQGYREQSDTSWYTSQLKAEGGRLKQPSFVQTATLEDHIHDADQEEAYSEPELTSSIERALDRGIGSETENDDSEGPPQSQDHVEAMLDARTLPPSSPLLALSNDESGHDQAHVANPSADHSVAAPVSALRPREGSQEPDYSMSVIRNSETIRSISPSKFANMTAEEHNALLLSDPRIRKSTVVHPDFLEQYYRESRLHHLSTWKADLKSQLQALAAEKTLTQKTKLKRLPGQRRYIMHVDFDSFFAAVSLKKSPQFKDKPAVVAHGGGSGSEIASCNYPAREFGISNGMWMKRAQDLCPELKILPYDFPGYEDASRMFYDAIMATDGVVQSVSIDEALVDISAICFAESGTDGVKRYEGAVHREQRKADLIAQQLRDEVLEKTGCAVSVGIGGNILLAKIALREAKPAGQYQLKPEEVLDYIGMLEVQKLPGVAWSIGSKLEEIGIKLVKDIRETTKEKLINTLGPKTGEKIWEYARGIDKTEVGDQVVRKSVSAEVNWGVRFENQAQVDEFMNGLCGELHKRLVKERVKGKQLTIKVMRRAADAPRDPPKHLGHGKCDTVNRSLQLGVATCNQEVIAKEVIALMRSYNISPGELRGIGVQMQKLEPVRSGAEGAEVGSQRKLQFKAGQSAKPAVDDQLDKVAEDPIEDDIKTPEKQRVALFNAPGGVIQPANPTTPTKRPLNMLGTQFVLPTQVDPSVLAELPEDIRAKLARHVRPAAAMAPPSVRSETGATSMPPSRARAPAVALPTQSQLDPSILDALPEDVRAEVLGFYRSPGNRKPGGQALLPQSPRKVRTLPPPAKVPLKRKRGIGGLFAGRARSHLHTADNATLTQSNFVARLTTIKHLQDEAGAAATATTTTDTEAEPEEMDLDFLAALPEDLRREVLDQQRQTRLQRTGGIDLSLHQRSTILSKRRKKIMDEEAGLQDLTLHLPPRRPNPTFTTRMLTELPALRNAVKAWFQEFSDEGPYDEDVNALRKYLRDVVIEEGDMTKAVAVVKWFAWVIENNREEAGERIRGEWERAVEGVRQAVDEAVEERGLGRVVFGQEVIV